MTFFSCTDAGPYIHEIQPSDNFDIYDSSEKKSVIRFFKEVALGMEYGSGYQVTQKWSSAMNIFVGGTQNDELLHELKLIIMEINDLVTDSHLFSVNIVNDSLNSNFYMFFGQPDDYVALFPEQKPIVDDNNFGLFHLNLDSNFVITSGHMYVNIDLNDSKLKKHILREELTQSLGLPKDLPYSMGIIFENGDFIAETFNNAIKNSIFYEGMSSLNSYNWADKLIITLLYHPNMSAGLDVERADSVLKGILGV